MNIEDQVTSLELSKKLKELGVKQDSYFKYEERAIGYVDIYHSKPTSCAHKYYSAFTVAELGKILPKYVGMKYEDENKKEFSNFRFVCGQHIIFENGNFIYVWSVNYICDTTNEFRNFLFDSLLTPPIYDENEVNSRAKMLIYLIENGLYKP